MLDIRKELFLKEYFLFGAIIREPIVQRKIFDTIADIYMITGEEREQLYIAATAKDVASIHTDNDYKRYKRIYQYAKSAGLPVKRDTQSEAIITIKGKILKELRELNMLIANQCSKVEVFNNIKDNAKTGVVQALRILGILQCEGILFELDSKEGIKNLWRSAKWNSAESEMALLKYDVENRLRHLGRLYSIAENGPFRELANMAKVKYKIDEVQNEPECELLSKAFGRKLFDKNFYMPTFAGLLYSEAIRFKDKEKLLLSDIKGMESIIADLPLKLNMRAMEMNEVQEIGASIRKTDYKKLLQSLKNNDIRQMNEYCPVCINTESTISALGYTDILSKIFENAHVAVINVNNLSVYDLEPTVNNIFLRNCEATKNNIFILLIKGDVPDEVLTAMTDFLQTEKRRKFHIAQPNIELDLSMILPICICDNENAMAVKPYCNEIKIEKYSDKEKLSLIKELLSGKERLYSMSKIKIEEDLLQKLITMDVDTVNLLLDKVICEYRNEQKIISLNKENTENYLRAAAAKKFGYGGSINGNK